jgi:hypothetical protein
MFASVAVLGYLSGRINNCQLIRNSSLPNVSVTLTQLTYGIILRTFINHAVLYLLL